MVVREATLHVLVLGLRVGEVLLGLPELVRLPDGAAAREARPEPGLLLLDRVARAEVDVDLAGLVPHLPHRRHRARVDRERHELGMHLEELRVALLVDLQLLLVPSLRRLEEELGRVRPLLP